MKESDVETDRASALTMMRTPKQKLQIALNFVMYATFALATVTFSGYEFWTGGR
jgi:hypothetical protein